MQMLMQSRIALVPQPTPKRTAALEVGMVGHCPGRTRPDRLLVMTAALDEMRAAGFGTRVDDVAAGNDTTLFDLPIPLTAAAAFDDVFPDAGREGCRYESRIAGNTAWLAPAVHDFFANGGERLWVVKVPETVADGDPREAFLPRPEARLHDIRTLTGIAALLVIPALGVVALPDLERLQVPAALPDIPGIPKVNPDPEFIPCASAGDLPEIPSPVPSGLSPSSPLPFNAVLLPLLRAVAVHRPDITILLTLPLTFDRTLGSPAADSAALASLENLRVGPDGFRLRHLQLLFPYLRGPGRPLMSAVGAVSGLQGAVAQRFGPWRSVSGQAMTTDTLPYPPQSTHRRLALRETPGISVVTHRRGEVFLDDERLAAPALPREETVNAEASDRFDAYRSAEVNRFMGYLRRALRDLGDTLVFDTDYRDPRPRLALDRFFRRLHKQGALRGALPEEAYRITAGAASEGVIRFDIEIAPIFPIDRLRLTFANLDGAWRSEVSRV